MKLCPTCLYCYNDDVEFCLDQTHEALISPRFGPCTIDGKYRLVKRLGRGGMGAVYEAIHLELDRPRAIKLLVPEYISSDPHARWRMRQEALTACNFDHPNLVRLYDFGTNIVSVAENGRVHAYDEQYIVMELLRGQSLKELLDQRPRLEIPQAVAIAMQIAEGLAEIHSKGIVYRDLKPANILICSDYKGDLLVKIVDFGAVKMRNTSSSEGPIDLTKAMFIGSPVYASPEHCKGEPLDERSDIYALGLILFEMIAGVRPFGSGGFLTLLNNHVYAEPRPLTDTPQDITDLTMRALRKDPSERPQTAREFAESLLALDVSPSVPGSQRERCVVTETIELKPLVGEKTETEETVLKFRDDSSREFTKVSVPVQRRVFRPKYAFGVAMIGLVCLTQPGSFTKSRTSQKKSNLVAAAFAPNIVQPAATPIATPTPDASPEVRSTPQPTFIAKLTPTPTPTPPKATPSPTPVRPPLKYQQQVESNWKPPRGSGIKSSTGSTGSKGPKSSKSSAPNKPPKRAGPTSGKPRTNVSDRRGRGKSRSSRPPTQKQRRRAPRY